MCGQDGKCPTCGGTFTVPQIDPRTGLAIHHADPGEDGENPTPMHAYAAAGDKAPQLIRLDDDSLIIQCPRCGQRSPITANRCQACKLPFTLEAAEEATAALGADGRATVGIVLGVLGLILSPCMGLGIVPGAIGLMLGLSALLRRQAGTKPRAAFTVILISLLACAVSALAVMGLGWM
jgi:hypothetical protein